MCRLRSTTSMPLPLMVTPETPLAVMSPSRPPPSRVIDLVTTTLPKLPRSSTDTPPPAVVLTTAPAKVLHGRVRLHGLASSPAADTQGRVARAGAAVLSTH